MTDFFASDRSIAFFLSGSRTHLLWFLRLLIPVPVISSHTHYQLHTHTHTPSTSGKLIIIAVFFFWEIFIHNNCIIVVSRVRLCTIQVQIFFFLVRLNLNTFLNLSILNHISGNDNHHQKYNVLYSVCRHFLRWCNGSCRKIHCFLGFVTFLDHFLKTGHRCFSFFCFA